MKQHLTCGPTPVNESCAQLGHPEYGVRAVAECKRYAAQLKRQFGEAPEGAKIRTLGFAHDFGTYYEVVVEYDTDHPRSEAYADRVQGNLPGDWDAEAVREIEAAGEP